VRSSTSSSSAASRAPAGPGWQQVAVLLLTAVLCLALHERWLRDAGTTPGVRNTPDLWALHAIAAQQGPSGVVLVGNSRMVNGIDPAVLSEALDGAPVYNLSVSGSHPLDGLAFVAQEVPVPHVVIVEASALHLLMTHDETRRQRWQQYASALDRPPVLQPFERTLDLWTEERLALLHPQRLLRDLLVTVAAGRPIQPPLETYARTRFGALRAASAPTALAAIPPPPATALLAQHVEDATARAILEIQARGGKVVFWTAPSGPSQHEALSARPTQAAAAERLRASADLVVDTQEIEALQHVRTYDDVHIDAQFVPLVSQEVAARVRPLLHDR
jgi:hypothetical protein